MLDLLLPQRCLVCGAGREQLCATCAGALPPIGPPCCERCGAPSAWPVRRCRECNGRRLAFATARAAVAYDDTVRRLVAGWKERGLRRFAETAAAIVDERVPRLEADAIAFVPPDADRRRRRGHHPAAELAEALALRWEIPRRELLTRAGSSERQRGLSLVERRRNVARAFVARDATERVVLVDDVYTSGATVDAAAAVLRSAGARRVDVVTFARAIRRWRT